MSKFPCATHSQGWTGIAEALDQHLSPVTFFIFCLAKPLQSLHSSPSSSGLICTSGSQQLWRHCFDEESFMAQLQKTEECGDTQSPQALQVADLQSGIIII